MYPLDAPHQGTSDKYPQDRFWKKNKKCEYEFIDYRHKTEIEEICRGASRELELEIKMRMTEEEWTEQVLAFEPYKRRGPIYLDKVSTERLLEQLEDAQALLANMLTSR